MGERSYPNSPNSMGTDASADGTGPGPGENEERAVTVGGRWKRATGGRTGQVSGAQTRVVWGTEPNAAGCGETEARRRRDELEVKERRIREGKKRRFRSEGDTNPKGRGERDTSNVWPNREAQLKPQTQSSRSRGKEGGMRKRKRGGHSPLRALVLLGFRDRVDERVRREAGAPYEQPKVDCATFTLTFAFAFKVA